MAEPESDTNGFVFRCPVWTLASKKDPGELLLGDLADGGKFICVFSDEDEEKTAADFRLPVEVIREALAYFEANKELLETEAEIERLMLKRGGVSRDPQPVSG